ncbi:MAG: hypothetical protein O3A00_16320, partial [Planctomycetota bacterium]|nr:hypothetical protein [Planctomycetota bacterium]
MSNSPFHRVQFFAGLLGALIVSDASARAGLTVVPTRVELRSPEASQQILVTATDSVGRAVDVTRRAEMSVDGSVAFVEDGGLLRPLGEGSATITVRFEGEQARIPVHVTGLKNPAPVSFRNEVIPILTKSSCNSGGCHGKAEGQAGFKLSIFGFDTAADHASLTKESRGRRVLPAQPAESLLLKKATSETPHGGGRKIELGSYRYRRVLRWITEGAAIDADDSTIGQIVRLEVEPTERRLLSGGNQQLQVTAINGR